MASEEVGDEIQGGVRRELEKGWRGVQGGGLELCRGLGPCWAWVVDLPAWVLTVQR